MNTKTKDTVLTGLMAAMISVLSVWQIPLPFGVPLTFQVFAAALAGYTLGVLRGIAATFVYVALGAAGLPVFTGFQGGLSVILGPSGGFVFGFLILCALAGAGCKGKAVPALALGSLGLLVCHAVGTLHFSLVTQSTLAVSLAAASLPYILKDAVLVAAAYFLSRPVRKSILKN